MRLYYALKVSLKGRLEADMSEKVANTTLWRIIQANNASTLRLGKVLLSKKMVDVRTVADRRQTVRDGTCTLLSREKATYLSAYRPPPPGLGINTTGLVICVTQGEDRRETMNTDRQHRDSCRKQSRCRHKSVAINRNSGDYPVLCHRGQRERMSL